MDIGINIEGQNGLNWPRWKRMVQTVEALGFAALTRSDHYTNMNPPDLDALEMWVSLTWLADHTSRIEFGPLVSPVSFRHPTMTARMAAAVDDLSNGRLILGLGAGWQVREHHNYGWDLLEPAPRFQRFTEAMEIIYRMFKSEEPLTYAGHYYQLHDAVILPRPQRPQGPPLLIGGNGEKKTLGLTAKYADEWNGVFISAERFAELNQRLTELLVAEGRDPQSVRRSLMTGIVYGRNDAELQAKLAGRDVAAMRSRGMLVGTPDALAEQAAAFKAAGVQRLLIGWLDLDDMDGLELVGRTLV